MTRHVASTRPTRPASPITGEYRDNLAELIGRLAAAGRNDPHIATHLGITVSQVRGLRADFDIPAGERRWLPARTCGASTAAEPG